MSLEPLLLAPVQIQIHAVTASAAMLLGALVLFRRKGTPVHKLMGRIWVGLMLVTATSAIFINEIRMIGPFSPIHIFVVMVYVGVYQAVRDIRRGNVRAHQAGMKSLYFGALVLTGAFTLLPGRRMHDVLFGVESGWWPVAIVLPIALGSTAYVYWRLMRPPRRRTA
jgi:uncharacterized membrane protein